VLNQEMTGGDFVRSMRMVVDICRQVASVTDGALRDAALDAVHAIDRGVVRGSRDLAATSDEEE
jgi:superfamily II RNA helicase